MRRRIQVVFQDPFSSLNPRMTVGAAIAEPLRVHGIADRDAAPAKVAELLDLVGLAAPLARRFPRELSGGQRQRVAIARSLAPQPELLIADEAVSALDVSVQAQILNLLLDLTEHLGLTMIFISHQLSVIANVADDVAVMYLGRIVEYGPVEQVFEHPQHPYTAALLAANPEPVPERRRKQAAIGGDIPSPLDIPFGLPVPDALRLRRATVRRGRPAGGGRRPGSRRALRRAPVPRAGARRRPAEPPGASTRPRPRRRR